MPLFSRATEEPGEAVYARVLDGRHLWVAVRGAGSLELQSDGVGFELPVEERDGLLTAVADLEWIGSGPATLVSGRGATPVRHAAPVGDTTMTRDPGPFVVESVDGTLVVRRAPAAGVEVTGLVATDDGVDVLVAPGATEASLVVKDQPIATVEVSDGVLALGAVPALVGGATATFRTGSGPLVRRSTVLARPNYAVLLPPMLEPDVELRWLKDGRLAVHRSAPA